MALEGSLGDFDLFSLFNMIKTQGKSGTLVLSRAQEFVKIYFDQGEIVGCDSNQVPMEDRVGALLVRLGRLTGEELMEMIQQQRQTLKRMGVLLLESGRVTRQDIQDALFNQAMAIIYRTFRWVEGDYRFDSMLPLDLDRENFPPIPVDTVLMEAARIMDEWPEVQRRLPDHKVLLARTAAADQLRLDIDQDSSALLDGEAPARPDSGLSHEEEVTLTYFAEPSSIQNVLQISRYDELDTCRMIADLLGKGLLEPSREADQLRMPIWSLPLERGRESGLPAPPSGLFWPLVALCLAIPLSLYVPSDRASLNLGLAALRPFDPDPAGDPVSRARLGWALELAAPQDHGRALAARLGYDLRPTLRGYPDLTAQPDPLAGIKPGD
jgi:hypothetical protein